MQPVRGGFWLIDGHALLYRSFHAIQDLTTSAGVPTNAIFGFIRTLQKLRDDYQPDHWVVAMDSHGPTFRHEESAAYKATRKPMPETLRPQLSAARDFLAAANIPLLAQPGLEADDIIATLAARFRGQSPMVIVSNDKDIHQLIGDDGVSVLAFKQGLTEVEWRDRAAVIAKFGVPPEQVRDLLALTGDGSDNIQGVAGIGPKTAAALLTRFGTIDQLYARLDEAGTPARVQTLRAAKAIVAQAIRLVTLRTDAAVPAALADYRRQLPDTDRLGRFFSDYELLSLQPKWLGKHTLPAAIPAAPPAADAPPAGDNQPDLFSFAVTEPAPEVLPELPLTDLPATLYLHRDSDIWHISDGERFAVLPDGPRTHAWQCWWQDRRHTLIGDQLKDVWKLCHQHGDDPQLHDIRLAAYVSNPDCGMLPLPALGTRVLNEPMPPPPTPAAALRLIIRVAATLAAADLPRELLALETDLIPVLGAMEMHGVQVDRSCLELLRERYRAALDAIVADITALTGETINLNSPKQLADLLFVRLGLKTGKKTGSKAAFSTDSSVLEKLHDEHPVVPLILRYRHNAKLLSTYVEALLAAADAQGHIATTFNQTVTSTGRLSSSEPNLQNIPIRSEADLDLRAAFVPDGPDRVLLCADYSQIELRVLAHIAQETALLAAFAAGEDVHTATAAAVFGIPAASVSREQRRQAKVVNFGLLYGMTEFRLARDLHLPRAEAKAFIDNYFGRYPRIRAYLDDTIARAEATGFVQTLTGRRRYFPELKTGSFLVKQAAQRAAVNMPIQGTAADIIKLAMRAVMPLLPGYDAALILQIHDELVFTVPATRAAAFAAALRPVVEQVMALAVPLVVDIRHGRNLRELAH